MKNYWHRYVENSLRGVVFINVHVAKLARTIKVRWTSLSIWQTWNFRRRVYIRQILCFSRFVNLDIFQNSLNDEKRVKGGRAEGDKGTCTGKKHTKESRIRNFFTPQWRSKETLFTLIISMKGIFLTNFHWFFWKNIFNLWIGTRVEFNGYDFELVVTSLFRGKFQVYGLAREFWGWAIWKLL